MNAQEMRAKLARKETTGTKETSDTPGKIIANAWRKASAHLRERKTNAVLLSKVAASHVEWLWPGRIAMGKLTIIVGDPDLGKSFLSLDLAARVTRGLAWPDDRAQAAPLGDVLLFNAEDGLADTVCPRLEAAGADMTRVTAITSVSEEFRERCFSLARDLDLLKRHLRDRPATRLVIIDPIAAYLGGGAGVNNTGVRELLTPLAKLAQDRNVAIVVVTHLNKKGGGRAMYRAMGSLAFVAAARAAWGVVRHPADEEQRLFLPVKNNLTRGIKGLAYRLLADEKTGTARVEWLPEPIEVPIDELLRTVGRDETNEATETSSVQEWLEHVLSEEPMDSNDLHLLASREGITPRQLRYAAQKLGVVRQKLGFLGTWRWMLPKEKVAPDSEN